MILPMLKHIGVEKVNLMTNNPRKVRALEDLGYAVKERVAIHTGYNTHNENYLAVKARKLGHMPRAD